MKKQSISQLARRVASLALVIVMVLQAVTIAGAPRQTRASETPNGSLKNVVVQFRGAPVQEGSKSEVKAQVAQLAQRQQWLTGALEYASGYKKLVRSYSQLPFAVYEVDAEGEASLRANPNVVSVAEDQILKAADIPFQVTPGVLGGDPDTGFSDGETDFTGDGYAVAVIDQGVSKSHPSLDGTVVSEACFGVNQDLTPYTISSFCPGGATASTASGSGEPCSADCSHGTMVASLVSGQPRSLTVFDEPFEFAGTAKDAKIIAIQVFVALTEKSGGPNVCGNPSNQTETCAVSLMSVVLAGLNHVLELHNNETLSVPIAAANMSIGIPSFSTDSATDCLGADDSMSSINTTAQALKDVNIATIAAAGNYGELSEHPNNQDKISGPACLSNVIAVSASSADDHMTIYTNAGPLTDLVAPGGEETPDTDHMDGGLFIAQPGESTPQQYTTGQGTSFAAPIVAGAWAVIREKAPEASVDGILQGLKETGVNITEHRASYTPLVHKRISIAAALEVADTFAIHQTPVDPPTPPPGGGSQPPSGNPANPGNPGTDTSWVPGTPKAGAATIFRATITLVVAGALLLFLNRSLLLKPLRR